MGFLRKIAAAAVAGVLCFVGTGALPESALMLQEHVFAASGETSSETRYYTGGYKDDFCGWKMDWSFTISYVILTKSYEDAPGDDAALDKHIKITGVSVSTSCIQLTAMNIIMIVIFRLLANLWLLANLFMKGAFPEMSKFQK